MISTSSSTFMADSVDSTVHSRIVGRSIGSVMRKNRCVRVAPSSVAASCRSRGIACSAAR
jgi:hypothetical protein